MTALSSHAPAREPASITWTLFVWLAVQTLALVLSALRVPLWASAPASGEFHAVYVLLIIQILAASLLSPRLTRDWRAAAMAAASCWPFTVLAGLLAVSSISTIVLAGGYVTGWLAVLWVWNLSLRTVSAKMIAAGVAATWAAAGPLLLFIHLEYSDPPPSSPPGRMAQIALGPLMHALRVVDSGARNQPDGWTTLLAYLRHPWSCPLDCSLRMDPWMVLAIVALMGCGAKWGIAVVTMVFSGARRFGQRGHL